jgi:hypothetical protein
MRDLLQTVIPVMLTAIVAGRVAVTRTGKLRKDIRENIDLLGKLSADHPNRAMLEANNGELLGLLVRRQQRRYGPFTQAGVSFGAFAGVAAVAFLIGCFGVLMATGVIPTSSDPPDPGDGWVGGVVLPGHGGRLRRGRSHRRPAPAPRAPAGGAAAGRGQHRGRLGRPGRRRPEGALNTPAARRPGSPILPSTANGTATAAGEARSGLLTGAQRRRHGEKHLEPTRHFKSTRVSRIGTGPAGESMGRAGRSSGDVRDPPLPAWVFDMKEGTGRARPLSVLATARPSPLAV